MRSIHKLLFASAALAALSQPALSVMVANQPKPAANSQPATSTVERGGTVEAIDTDKKTLTVDSRSYALASSGVVVHNTSNASDSLKSLKPGTTIRFRTNKNNLASQEQVTEIWMVTPYVPSTRATKK